MKVSDSDKRTKQAMRCRKRTEGQGESGVPKTAVECLNTRWRLNFSCVLVCGRSCAAIHLHFNATLFVYYSFGKNRACTFALEKYR